VIGSACSGIGGFERGLEMAGWGPVAWQIEPDPWCKQVLARHWPGVRIYDDVRFVSPRGLAPIDVLCAGFPCQGNSSAGKGEGLADPRSALWFSVRDLAAAIRPPRVLIENVASGAARWLPHVRRDLHLLGYRTRAIHVSAFDVGAPHRRRRVFVCAADPDRVVLREPEQWRPAGRPANRLRDGRKPESGDAGACGALADADAVRELRERGDEHAGWRWSRNGGRWSIVPPISGVADGVSRRLDGRVLEERCRMLGNAVVPQCAAAVARAFDLWAPWVV